MKMPSEKRICKNENCGKVFDTKNYGQRYCTKGCAYQANKATTMKRYRQLLIPPVEVTCALKGCDHKFIPNNGRKYCSAECLKIDTALRQIEDRKNRKPVKIKCASPGCNNLFVREFGHHKYCSHECAHLELKVKNRISYNTRKARLLKGDVVRGRLSTISQDIQKAKDLGLTYGQAKLKGVI